MFVSKMIHPSTRRYILMSKIMSRNRMLPHTSTVKYSIQNNVNGPLVNKTNNKSRKEKKEAPGARRSQTGTPGKN